MLYGILLQTVFHIHCSVKLFLKKSTTNKFQRYSPKTDNELITENEYEKMKTNDLIVTTGFSNPMYSENNCKYFKVCRTNESIITNHCLHKLYRRTMTTTTDVMYSTTIPDPPIMHYA